MLRGQVRSKLALWGMSVLLMGNVSAVLAETPVDNTAPPDVTYIELKQEKVDLTKDLVGEIKAYQEVDLRARVSGNLIEIAFRPGQRVKKGDLLFVIDPAQYQTALANAKAGLAQAKASWRRVMQDVERYKPLLPDNAIPRQVYDQAVAQAAQEKAMVDSRDAEVKRAELDLQYTKISSPLDGRVGMQQVEVGALISAGQTILAQVSTMDPVVVYFNLAETEYLSFMKRRTALKSEGKIKDITPPIELILADGSVYPQKGKIDFADPSVNATTGTLTLRAVFPNTDALLKAGMNSRVRIYYDEIENGLLIPQRAVTESLGRYFVTIIKDDNSVEQRAVILGARIEDKWLVKEGVIAGERLVVDGLQKVKPGSLVSPQPLAAAPQLP